MNADAAPTEPAMASFLADVAVAEQQTPLPPTYPGDPAAAAAFARAAQARGTAIAKVISTWLTTAPYRLLAELLDQPREVMPIFQPRIGPVIVARQDLVRTCLSRTDLFTVDPYAAEMARATDDKARNPEAFTHFLLGMDREDLYRLDDVLLRRVVSRADREQLVSLARKEGGPLDREGAGERHRRDRRRPDAGQVRAAAHRRRLPRRAVPRPRGAVGAAESTP